MEEFDIRLKTPFTYIASGASMSGKTTHVFNIIKYRHLLFDVVPSNIIYYYNQWQNGFTEYQNQGIVTEWINKLPNGEELQDKTIAHKDSGGSIVVIDDFIQEIGKEIADLFTILCHANNINVFLLTQNIFANNPYFRIISLNATYISVFKNPRDSSQISHFAKQFAPHNPKYIVDAFKECTMKAHSYMLFDSHQSTDDEVRVRSNILPHEGQPRAWIPNAKRRRI